MTINYVPPELYGPAFYGTMLLVAYLLFLAVWGAHLGRRPDYAPRPWVGIALLVALIGYLGLRPVDGVFVDMPIYARMFLGAKDGIASATTADPAFNAVIRALSPWADIWVFFTVCAILYVAPLFLASRNLFGRNATLGFLALVSGAFFWAYGTNGIRNGIATSIFIFGLSLRSRAAQVLAGIVAVAFHASVLVLLAALVLSLLVRSVKVTLVIWCASIPVSLVAGVPIQRFIGDVGWGDQRISYLAVNAGETMFRATGFRWDFVLYSCIGVAAGSYFVFRRRYRNDHYLGLFRVYLLANAFWILIINASYSNRFAYLSWSFLSLVVVFPLLRGDLLVPRPTLKAAGLVMASTVGTMALVAYPGS